MWEGKRYRSGRYACTQVFLGGAHNFLFSHVISLQSKTYVGCVRIHGRKWGLINMQTDIINLP